MKIEMGLKFLNESNPNTGIYLWQTTDGILVWLINEVANDAFVVPDCWEFIRCPMNTN